MAEKIFYRLLLKCAGACILVLMICQYSHAQQQDWEKEGGIPSAEIEIVKDRQIVLPSADRIFEKIPPRPLEPVKPEMVYAFRKLNFNTPDFSPILRPLKLKQEDITKVYGNLVSVGYGNYNAPYLEAYINSKRDKMKMFGAHFYHQSYANGPIDNNNSANGATELNIFGKAMSNSVILSGNLNFEDRTTFFYGYVPGSDPKRESIRQDYNIFALGAGIQNAKPADFSYSLQGSFSYLSDHYKATEGELGLSLDSKYRISDKSSMLLTGDYYFIDRKDSVPGIQPRHLFRLRPAYFFKPIEKLWLTIGANVALENDTLVGKKPFHFYPNLRADYKLAEGVTVYAAFTGDMDKVTLHTLSRENLWVNSNLSIAHTNRVAEFQSGLKGNLAGKVAFGLGVSLATLKNFYYFKNDSVHRSKFDVVYDGGTTQRENLFAEVGFHQGEAVKLVLRGDYFHYTTDRLPTAYHRPTYRVALNSSYNFYGKVRLEVDFLTQGGMKAYDSETKQTVTLNPAVDLNARGDYFFSKRVSAFVKCNNILSSNYQLYLHYPVRGFQVMGGVTLTF